MKKLLVLFLPLVFAFGTACTSSESLEEDDDPQRRPSDGAGYGGDTTFIRETDPISRHQQTLRGSF